VLLLRVLSPSPPQPLVTDAACATTLFGHAPFVEKNLTGFTLPKGSTTPFHRVLHNATVDPAASMMLDRKGGVGTRDTYSAVVTNAYIERVTKLTLDPASNCVPATNEAEVNMMKSGT
jgi:hypothetical protein